MPPPRAISRATIRRPRSRTAPVNSAKVANDSLTGDDVNESTLGTVTNSDQLDGLHANEFLQSGATAGGALSGSFPAPSLDVSGGPCPNGRALTDISADAALTCGPGVFADGLANTAAGIDALRQNTGGQGNTAVGQNAGRNASGNSNIFLGDGAGVDVGGGDRNIIVGHNGYVGDQKKIRIGVQGVQDGTVIAGIWDTTLTHDHVPVVVDSNGQLGVDPSPPAGGALAGSYPDPTLDVSGGDADPGTCKNGRSLTGISDQAALTCRLGVFSDGEQNIAVGGPDWLDPYPSLTTGSENSAFGAFALRDVTTGLGNTASGYAALQRNTTGVGNAALGWGALARNSTGISNVAVGTLAQIENQSGSNNTAVGEGALRYNEGSSNTALGQGAGQDLRAGNDHNVDIANNGVQGESNTTRIGTDGNQNRAFIAGISGTTVGGSAAQVLVDANGQLGTASSSRFDKTDIEPLAAQSDPLMKLDPVSFRYRSGSDELHYGLIAEQVAKVMPTLVAWGRDGLPETVQYQELPALLLGELQQQRRENRALRAENDRQQEQIDWLLRQARGN